MAALTSIVGLIEGLSDDARLGADVVHSAFLPGSEPDYGELDPPLPLALAEALARSGAGRLWRHQAEGIAAVRRGEDLLVTTPTASGKSLIFQAPVLEEAASGGIGRALFLFPLKALGQDQKQKFEALAAAAGLAEAASIAIYDGDTPREERARIKLEWPRAIVTNPDMLHAGILGSLSTWMPFLAGLKWIVLDELHTYRGIFGCHFHHVLRRLLRACRAQGAEPRLIASSATAENADEFARSLSGRSFHWVKDSGAPREGRHFVLLRPLQSPYTTTLHLLTRLLDSGAKTIVFTKARRITELLHSWLTRQRPELARRVASYRSGFLPEERRLIEHRLFTGELAGVISTSALEMGIDVGGLDACVLVGYPGSMMATWQRAGRVGRAGQESLTALVALPDALDQYLLDHPDEFLARPCERLVVDPGNEPVARSHLVCAAAEMPLSREDDRDYLEDFAPLVGDLLAERKLVATPDGAALNARQRRPHREVNLRGTGASWTIKEAATGRTIGTVDGVRVFAECHPGAIYLHGGRSFLMRELDFTACRALAEPAHVDSFTTPLNEKETTILEILERREDGPLSAALARLEVRERVIGYEEKRIGSQEVLARHALELPDSRFETVGLFWQISRPIEETLRLAGEHLTGSLHASEHAALSLFPLVALCDRGDVGGISYPFHPQLETPAVFLYDGHPGGIGVAQRVYRDVRHLLDRVLDLVVSCPCEGGCPSCIQSPKCGNGNRPLDKAGAAHVVRLLLGREEPSEAARLAADLPRAEPPAPPRRAELAPALPTPSSDPPESASSRVGEAPVRLSGWDLVEPDARRGRPTLRGSRVALPLFEASPEPDDLSSVPPVVIPSAPSLVLPSAPSLVIPSASEGPGGAGGREEAGAQGPPAQVPSPRTVLFDVETRRSADDVGGWNNAHKMGVAVAVALVLEEGRFEVYEEPAVPRLIELLKGASLVVGYNIRRFDYAVLAGYTGEDYSRTLPTLDLLEDLHRRLGFRLGLGAVAEATLGIGKSADGLQSLEWFKQGRLDLITDYCRRDVEVMRDVYLHGRREGFVLYKSKRGDSQRVAVEW